MSVFTILSYINKVSVIAFFITTIVVGYQLYILRKERGKDQTPSIPDFKENGNIGGVANFTSLPNSLMKKDLKAVNYSKMIFPIISLMTLIVIIFVISLIGQNSTSNNHALVNPPPATISQTQVRISPTPRFFSSPTLTSTLSAELISPTLEASPSPIIEPTVEPTIEASSTGVLEVGSTEASPTGMLANASVTTTLSPSVSPTEIILALAPSSIPATTGKLSPTAGVIKVLPETGSVQKGLMIIGVAISTIFFSFWF